MAKNVFTIEARIPYGTEQKSECSQRSPGNQIKNK